MTLCLYELAKNPELQRKAQREIDDMLLKSSVENINYEMIAQLKYLECCIDETLRKYPPAPFLIRECTETYQVSDLGLSIPKGTPIIISSFGLHRDPDIFKDPLTWTPERFLRNSTGSEKSDGLFYLPFGVIFFLLVLSRDMTNFFNFRMVPEYVLGIASNIFLTSSLF